MSRGKSMSARIQCRDGKWGVAITHKGRRKYITAYDKATARRIQQRYNAMIALGEDWYGDDKSAQTFGVYANEWMRGHPRHNCKPGTYNVWSSVLTNRLLPFFGDRSLAHISPADVRAFAYSMRERYSDNYAKSILSVLHNVLESAVADELIPTNPANNLGRHLPRRQPKEPARVFTRGELSAILSVIQQHFPRDYPLFLTLARTGMRIGEGLGLQWGDISWKRGLIHIQRTNSDQRIGTPKSGKSRYVDMSQQLQDTLHNWQIVQEIKGVGQADVEWLFPDRRGNPQRRTSVRERTWKPALDIAGIDYARPHTLRHTYASLLLQAGESMVYVQEQLGHSSIKETVDTYGHLIPGGNRAAVDKLDDIEERATHAH